MDHRVEEIKKVVRGWGKIKSIATYMDSCPRSVRSLLKMGLPHVRLPSGTILISYSDVDNFLRNFQVNKNAVDEVVDQVMRDLVKRTDGHAQ